jgi:uncharacterized protein YabN with tetrapyrrole methylase and pyrophosphatase domain
MSRTTAGRRQGTADPGAFLRALGTDVRTLRAFLLDPRRAMNAAMLSAADKSTLLRGVPAQVSRAVMRTPPAATKGRGRRKNGTRGGELVVVGTGIDVFTQLTPGARAWIEAADEVLHVVNDAATSRLLRQLNPNTTSLITLYGQDKPRERTYEQMVQRMLAGVRRGHLVCAVFYGHPGVFTYPGHEAIRRCRREGIPARMLPAVSTDACLFADLGVDPATHGYQSYEATNFVTRVHQFDPSSALVLWQVDSLGDRTYQERGFKAQHLPVLRAKLLAYYGARHPVVLYRAAIFSTAQAEVRRVALGRLTRKDVVGSTMYVPPKRTAARDLDVLKRLGLDRPGRRRRSLISQRTP